MNDYEHFEIFKIKFLAYLKKRIIKNPKATTKREEIQQIIYDFILSHVKIEDQIIEGYCLKLFYDTVDFCLYFGSTLLNILEELKIMRSEPNQIDKNNKIEA